MICITIPLSDGLAMAVVGLTADDAIKFVSGVPAPMIDFRDNFKANLPIPTLLKFVYGDTNEDIMDIIRRIVPDLDEHLVTLNDEDEE